MASVLLLVFKTAGIESGGTNALTWLMTGGTIVEPEPWAASTVYATPKLVSYSGHAYACTTGHTSTGSFDASKFADLGACSPLPTPALDTVYTLYYVVRDTTTLADSGQNTSAAIAPTLPSGWVGCFTSGGTFSATPTTGATAANGGYQPLYAKQTARVVSSPVGLSLGDPSFATGTRVAAPTVTATAGDTQVTLTWSAVSGATSYDLYQSTTNSAPAYGATPTVAGVTSGVVRTGFTNGTPVYFWVRSNGVTGCGAWPSSVTATPATVSHTDEFNAAANTAPDSSLHDVVKYASADAVVQDGNGSVVTTAIGLANYYSALWYHPTIDRSATHEYRVMWCSNSLNSQGGWALAILDRTTTVGGTTSTYQSIDSGVFGIPTSAQADTSSDRYARIGLMFSQPGNNDTYTRITAFRAVPSGSGLSRYFTGSAWDHDTSWQQDVGVAIAKSTTTKYQLVLNTDATNFRFRVLSEDGNTTIFDTGNTAWSTVRGFNNSTQRLIEAGRPFARGNHGQYKLDWFNVT